MKNTVLLIDTDVLLDYLFKRQPFLDYADNIVKLLRTKQIKGYVSAQSLINAFYILRNDFAFAERKAIVRSFCYFVTICNVSGDMVVRALEDTSFSDFEDCVQMQCAISVNADFIITRNTKDFANSRIKAITPAEFLDIIKEK
jgi:predicted nucleic acid-binding protein